MNRIRIHDKEFSVFISHQQILNRVEQIAEQINRDYEGRRPVFMVVLNGAFLFAAELYKRVTLESEIGFIRVKSYAGTSSTGEVKEWNGTDIELKDRHVILVEDIIDSGRTAKFLMDEFKHMLPADLKIASLLVKPSAIKFPVVPDYAGFEISDDFVIGFGLDYDGLGRNLNHLYQLV